MRSCLRRLHIVWMLLLCASSASAHESRPAYLEVKETAPGRYDVLWRTPVNAGMRLPVELRFPEDARTISPPAVQELFDSRIERRSIDLGPDGLARKRIEFAGLHATITDVYVRMIDRNGASSTALVRPTRPWFEPEAEISTLGRAAGYLRLGIEHILLGVDHLLFVLGLLLIVRGRRQLLWTVTSFTLAHSVTLALATLGVANVPAAPLNAAIALSILFLGPEIVRVWRGESSFTTRHPWIIAFGFGLLHGFGFASGLTTIGLPRMEVALGLLSFNVGVELAQLGFVLLVLALVRAFSVLEMRWPVWVARAPGYAVGVFGAFWSFQRVALLFVGS